LHVFDNLSKASNARSVLNVDLEVGIANFTMNLLFLDDGKKYKKNQLLTGINQKPLPNPHLKHFWHY